MRKTLAVLVALIIVASPAFATIGDGLLTHRAHYTMRLKRTEWASGVSGFDGRMVVEFTASCDGFATVQRFVTQMVDNEGQVMLGDLAVTSWESNDGARFKFDVKNDVNGTPVEKLVGTAELPTGRDAPGTIAYSEPAGQNGGLPAGSMFPTEFTTRLIAAARAGERHFKGKIFDGSLNGAIYDAYVIIGLERRADETDLAIPGGEALREMKAWPVTISYYPSDKPADVPDYEVTARLFENGATSALTLDYGNFQVSGTLDKIEPVAAASCP